MRERDTLVRPNSSTLHGVTILKASAEPSISTLLADKACGPAGIAVFKSFIATFLIAPFTLNEETFRVATTSLA